VSTWDLDPGVVELPDGRRLRGRGLRQPAPAGPAPHFGVYLLGHDPGPFDWEHRWVRWPDFRTPASTPDALAALQDAYERSAAVAVLAGMPPAEAVAWVRRHYNRRAVETPWQRRWVRNVGK
jgi:hypothetical protein